MYLELQGTQKCSIDTIISTIGTLMVLLETSVELRALRFSSFSGATYSPGRLQPGRAIWPSLRALSMLYRPK